MSNLYHGRPKQYVEDHPDAKIYPVKCVPNNRPKGSWTNGVPAWTKPTTSTSPQLVGWFAPPRLRNKGWKNRSRRAAVRQEEE